MINKERKAQGAIPVCPGTASLSGIARGTVTTWQSANYFSHKSPEGLGFPDRYQQAGYACSVPQGNTIYTGAENIFQNNLYDRVVYTGQRGEVRLELH